MWQTLSIKVDKHQQIYARMHLFITLYTDLKYLAAVGEKSGIDFCQSIVKKC